MYPVSADFIDAIDSGNQLAAVRVAAYLGDYKLGDLDILGGSVAEDSRRDGALRSLSLNLSPDDDAWGWLATYGAEIRVWRGLMLSGVEELVPLGVYIIDSDLEEADDGTINVNGADRSQRISRARWTNPYVVAAGTDVGIAIGSILTDRWPDVTLGFGALGVSLSAQLVLQEGGESDPWKDARALAESAGYDLHFDGEGIASVRRIPDPQTASPAIRYFDGEQSVVITETVRASFATAYNGVIATGEGTDVAVPVRGEAWDEDEASPTYRYGPMGQVPMFYSSPLLTTQAQVDSAALTRLAKVRGRTESMGWTMLVNPAQETLDVIELVTTDGASRRFMLDQLTIPLSVSEPMSATARETRSAV